jgi:hypothetical protein
MISKKFSVACGEAFKAAPDGLFKRSHDLCGYATVEVPDGDGDVIQIDGVRLNYFKEWGALPLLAQHRKALLENGKPPTVGAITEFVRTDREILGRKVPALAFGAEWEKAETGEGLTELATKFKSCYDQRTLSTFSMGFDTYAIDQKYKGRGTYITESDPFEVSCCVVPVNRYATVIRKLKADLGEEFDPDELNEIRLAALHDDNCAFGEALKSHTTIFDRILRRLDDIDSAVAAASEGRTTRQTSSRELSEKDVAGLKKVLGELSQRLA